MNTESSCRPAARASRRSARFRFFVMAILAIVAAVSLTSCEDDDPYYDGEWYLDGTYQNVTNYDDTFTFYSDGTGYYETAYGDWMDFDYYCYDDMLYLTMYPQYGPAYNLDCGIDILSRNSISITFPPGNGFGYTTIIYQLVY